MKVSLKGVPDVKGRPRRAILEQLPEKAAASIWLAERVSEI